MSAVNPSASSSSSSNSNSNLLQTTAQLSASSVSTVIPSGTTQVSTTHLQPTSSSSSTSNHDISLNSLNQNTSTTSSSLASSTIVGASTTSSLSNMPPTTSTTPTSGSSVLGGPTPTSTNTNPNPVVILNKQRLQELVEEIDPREQLDDDVEDMLLTIADDFIENLVTSACQIAKHRGSKTLDVKDLQLVLEKNYNMCIPGFGSLPIFHQFKHLYKKSPASEAHKQRMALIKKTLKKF